MAQLKLALATLAAFVFGAVAIFAVPVEFEIPDLGVVQEDFGPPPPGKALDLTKPEWVVIFRLPYSDREATAVSLCELRVVVRASSEGEATLRAYQHACLYLSPGSASSMKFFEAAEKSKEKPNGK